MLRDLRLPAAIAKVVLAGAMQDFIDEVEAERRLRLADAGARPRATFTRERIEDYISAATAGGPLMPDRAALRPAGSMTVYRRRGLSLLVACVAVDDDRSARRAPPTDPELRILSPGEDAYVTGPTLLRARVEPPGPGHRAHVFRRRPPGVRADPAAVRVRMGRRAGDRGAPGARRRDAQRRRAGSCRRCGPSRSATPNASTSTSSR